MKTFIYYPGMEVRDELWLKFALLWLERLAFVFTVSDQSRLPPLLARLARHSDLLAPPPSAADFDAITPPLMGLLGNLLDPGFVRHKVFGNRALIARWRVSANHDCFCPDQPGLAALHQYCLDQGLASREQGGIRMARRLANLLSMYLAREWALTHDGLLITDHDYLDRLLHLSESRYQPSGGQACFHLEMGLRLPGDLANLSFDALLARRAAPGYGAALGAFHLALTTLCQTLGKGTATREQLQTFAQARDALEQKVLGEHPDASPPVLMPLTWLISTEQGAQSMLSRLRGANEALARPLIFHPIRQSHFQKRKSRHGFTRLGQIRRAP